MVNQPPEIGAKVEVSLDERESAIHATIVRDRTVIRLANVRCS